MMEMLIQVLHDDYHHCEIQSMQTLHHLDLLSTGNQQLQLLESSICANLTLDILTRPDASIRRV